MKRSRINFPARYPPLGSWPAQMRADVVAAYLDFSNTSELAASISRGEVPPPSSFRGKGRNRQPVWNRGALDQHLVPRLSCGHDQEQEGEDLRSLV
jgi:hypothetical protein